MYVITGLGLGGAETVTVDIANRIVDAGNEVMILYLKGDNIYEKRLDKRIKLVGLKMSKTPWGTIKGFFKIYSVIKKFKPDIVHGQMVHANIMLRIIRLFYPVKKLISTEHNINIESELRMKLYKLTDSLSDFNTNVSQEALDYFIERKSFSASKSKAVYNGIDLSRFVPDDSSRKVIRKKYGIEDDEFLWLNVGRLTESKDQSNLITAFVDLCKKTDSKMKLMIVGEGELSDFLKKLSFEKNASDRIIFPGPQENIQDFYNACDCFILSSAWEGFGIVTAEAMACGVPVISTDAGGCREVVDNPDFVIPVRDNKALYEKMKYIYNLPEDMRIAIGKQNTEKAKRYDINSIVKQWIEIYKS